MDYRLHHSSIVEHWPNIARDVGSYPTAASSNSTYSGIFGELQGVFGEYGGRISSVLHLSYNLS